MYNLTVTMMKNEYWYGLAVLEGTSFPLHFASEYEYCIEPNPADNQAAPLLLSSEGRYIWCDAGIAVKAHGGSLQISSRMAQPQLFEGFKTLRGAFLSAAKKHFPANGKMPPQEFFTKPQYNTWIELLHNQNSKDILNYAKQILKQGLPAGILMIDDGWMEYCGKWEFNRALIPNPQQLIKELHDMGFLVMLWTCPFVSPDSKEFRSLEERGLLVQSADGETAIRHWWNGYSAVLDMTNPSAAAWYEAELQGLMERYDVDGFKFDAGDAMFYREDDITFSPTSPNAQSAAWAEFGERFLYNEYRACYCCAGKALVQRLADRKHSWDIGGLASVVPNLLTQSILGYAFTCPDMIGGGQEGSFRGKMEQLDAELFVRYAQCSALMPMMQFSTAPWRVLQASYAQLCVAAAKLHGEFAESILALARLAAQSGEPIVRCMEYVFPHEGLAQITDQFMLGDTILVAPVLQKGARTRKVVLPKGNWRYQDGTCYLGGEVTVASPLEVLAYFTLVD